MRKAPLLKYCGIHSFEDLIVTSNSKADYLGFIFADSKRKVCAMEVKQWLSKVKINKKLVGVFVNANIEEIEYICHVIPLDVIQCHGEETVDYMLTLKAKVKSKLWKVIHHSDCASALMKLYDGIADGYVIDSKVKGQRGGTGMTFNWNCIPTYLRESEAQHVPCFIAGGVNERTVSRLLSYEPNGIDLCSGIEVDNKKNDTLIKRFESRLL